jgi:hypothetical protein
LRALALVALAACGGGRAAAPPPAEPEVTVLPEIKRVFRVTATLVTEVETGHRRRGLVAEQPPATLDGTYALIDVGGQLGLVRFNGTNEMMFVQQPGRDPFATKDKLLAIGPVDALLPIGARLLLYGMARAGGPSDAPVDETGELPRQPVEWAIDLDGDRQADVATRVEKVAEGFSKHAILREMAREIWNRDERGVWRLVDTVRWGERHLIGP